MHFLPFLFPFVCFYNLKVIRSHAKEIDDLGEKVQFKNDVIRKQVSYYILLIIALDPISDR